MILTHAQLTIEERPRLSANESISADIARHFYKHMNGTAVVVCEHPTALISSVRRKWWAIYRHLLKERSSTLDAAKIGQITEAADYMLSLRFTTRPSLDNTDEAAVTFSTPSELARTAPYCRTLYIACPVTKEQLHLITSFMPPGSVVVVYNAE